VVLEKSREDWGSKKGFAVDAQLDFFPYQPAAAATAKLII